ncbi:MAG: HoxN/HupN/NixA family nickel/cobalt transporter [Collimonas sp.]|uniref:HoxN/HupN/NixA family nickel/cobalt transporter n=1 Tax=Collimonas sp. TaxID=1963772 RepID=UPI003264A4D4
MKFTPSTVVAAEGGRLLGRSGTAKRQNGKGAMQSAPAGNRLSFNAAEWRRLGGFYAAILCMHLLGGGLFFYYSTRYPALIGLGFAAYMFGLRHAFDADHIAAVDDTVRFLLQQGQKPLGVGFFFSLGHSTVVLVLALAIAIAAASVKHSLPELQHYGSSIGAGISGIFLWLIGILNLLLLLDMLKIWRLAKKGQHSHAHLDELLARRGLLNRMFGGRLQKIVRHSWQMYPLGLLFGLDFDTASEIGLLAMTAGAASGNLPLGAVLSLPILFAAGMSLMDTTDGVLMVKAYNWAFVNPLRKIFYNLTTTSLSITVALVIGGIELSKVLIHLLQLKGPLYDYVGELDFGLLGYLIVGIFLLVWAGSAALWKFNKIEQRLPSLAHTHEHTHASGDAHAHQHFH